MQDFLGTNMEEIEWNKITFSSLHTGLILGGLKLELTGHTGGFPC